MVKLSRKTSITAISVSLLFFFSSLATPSVIGLTNAKPAALAVTPLTQLQANWASPNGNPFNQDFNPQNQINSSNAQNLGLSWLFPLPTLPTALLSVNAGGGVGYGVDTAPLIINGTIYMITQFNQVFALNAANGNVIWTDVIPLAPNSTVGLGAGPLSLHLHEGDEQFTTKLFNHTPTLWLAASNFKDYAINAQTGAYELNFSIFNGITPDKISGNNPAAFAGSRNSNLLVDENRGIVLSSINSGSSSATGRCFYRGWNILVTPPQIAWTAFCTPPQPGSNIPLDPNWDVKQVNSMKGAEIFYPGPSANAGGYIPNDQGQAVVNLKTLSPSVLNSTLYDDWGESHQSAACAAATGGASTGSTAAGWGSPWLLGTGPTAGLAFVNTNNRDPYGSICTPGPGLWGASILALNDSTGQWVWGFQTATHELWDYDCSWWQALGNETVNGVNTQVLWKTCKNGYLYELNAVTGNLIWAWTPPLSIVARCPLCYMLNPLNASEMSWPFFNPSLQPTICTPCTFGYESEGAYSPVSNYIYLVSQNNPQLWKYIAINSTNYRTTSGVASSPVPGQKSSEGSFNNATVEAVDASTGQLVWSHFIPNQGYRGGVSTSGNVVFVTLSSGDFLMLNAKTGDLIKDLYIGGPLNVLPSIGATVGGQMMVIFPITVGEVTWGTSVPGDLVALTLQSPPSATTNTVTSTATTTVGGSTMVSVSTVTASAASTGVDTTTVYGIAAVAVIFIIATGYLAMTRGRKPAA